MMKVRFFLNFDTEESWLNRMADEGWLLAKRDVAYRFTAIEPGSAVVRVDYRPSMNQADFADYLTLFADSGWHHLTGARRGGPQYFASFAGDGDAEIFSDSSSRALRYRRSLATYGAVIFPLLVTVFVLWTQGSLTHTPGNWYLTPGLWDKQGIEFLGAFLFETPFVIFREFVPVLLVALCVYFALAMAYQWSRYRRETR